MSSVDKKEHAAPSPAAAGNGNGVVAPLKPPAMSTAVSGIRQTYGDRRLRINPNKDHKPDKYDDLKSDFDPAIFSSLERHLPPSMLDVSKEAKIQFMKEILGRYLPEGERARVRFLLVLFLFRSLGFDFDEIPNLVLVDD